MAVGAPRFREIDACRADEFVRLGHARRHVFPHRAYYVPKCGPDGYKLATRMCGPCRLDELWEVLLFAAPALAAEFPRDLFFDDDLVWHQQQFGRPGLIATANLLLRGSELYSMVHQADIVQRAARRPEHRTRLQKRFKGWDLMLLNAVLTFALERDVATVRVPTAALALTHTDRKRTVGPALFERVYDHHVQAFCAATRDGDWWRIDVRDNAGRVVRSAPGAEAARADKVICVCHDIEGGLGHVDIEPAFAAGAQAASGARIAAMLDAEAAADVPATYHVVGLMMAEVRAAIEAQGHAVAFHSFDHRPDDGAPQLARCRQVDYRIKGYRPPQSKITQELTAENLCFHNFEWLASSARSLGCETPALERGLARVPIAFDDFPIHRDGMSFDEWERRALETIEGRAFVAFSMHDCYAAEWLPRYGAFLRRVRTLGTLRTVDDVAADLFLGHAA